MSTLSIRLPHWLHEAAREMAEREGTSINHLIALALAEKASALMTEAYLGERAQRGERAPFERAMGKAADVEAGEEDRL